MKNLKQLSREELDSLMEVLTVSLVLCPSSVGRRSAQRAYEYTSLVLLSYVDADITEGALSVGLPLLL